MMILEAKNIKKNFGKLEVLKGVDLSVAKGAVIAIIGPSGSGKSTFLRCLINLEKVNGGDIIIDGETVVANGVYLKSREAKDAYKFRRPKQKSWHVSFLRKSDFRIRKIPIPLSFRAVSSSALQSRGRWRLNRIFCCLTSRPPPSTRRWSVKFLPS